MSKYDYLAVRGWYVQKLPNPDDLKVKRLPDAQKREEKLEIRVTLEELYLIDCLAATFTGGNRSLWIRHAASVYRPFGTRETKALVETEKEIHDIRNNATRKEKDATHSS